MQDTNQLSGDEAASVAAPKPILGLEPDPAKERRRVATSRIALGFAVAACVFGVVYVVSALYGFLMGFAGLVPAGGCWAVGLILGIRARQTRNGKAAIVLSLLLLLIMGILGF